MTSTVRLGAMSTDAAGVDLFLVQALMCVAPEVDIVDLQLRESHIPLAQVAAAMGYSEHSVFTRACRRWFGRAPSAVRSSEHHPLGVTRLPGLGRDLTRSGVPAERQRGRAGVPRDWGP